MAEFTGTMSPGDIDTVYSRTAIGLGTKIFDTDGNEYIFFFLERRLGIEIIMS